jgi:hypothetical protein
MIYAARSGNKWFAVIDGKESDNKYDDVDTGIHSFSPDSKRLAYSVFSGGKVFVIVDGKEEMGKYLGIGAGSTVFSPNNLHLAYVALLKGCTHSEEEREKDKKSHQEEEEACVVVDGKESKTYNLIWEPPVFSPDGKQVAYFTWIKSGWYFVKDNIEFPQKYDAIGSRTLIFSPDGKHTAFLGQLGEEWCVAVDGQAGKKYDGIITVRGGKITFDSNDQLSYLAVDGSKIFLVEEKITERPLSKP